MKDDLRVQLARNGFIIIDLLNETEINYLNQQCDKYLQANENNFISSSHVLNKNDSDLINTELHTILDTRFKRSFPDLQLLGGTLATKIKGTSEVEIHRDWTIVDETKYNSYNLWIPLVDTSSENGTLGLIPGSHKWSADTCGFNISNLYAKFTKQFIKIGFEPALKAGQAILYDHRLLHYSRPNKKDENRNTAIVGVKNKDGDLRVSFCLDNHNIETFEASEKDFYQFDPSMIKKNNKQISVQELISRLDNWKKIRKNVEQNLPEEFSYLIPERDGFLAEFLNKIGF